MSRSRIVLATGNAGKLAEIAPVLAPRGLEVVPQSALDVDEAVEDGLSFVENALIKARHAARRTGLPAIADDSGLEVEALNGAPGIHSSRYAGETATDRDNLERLLSAMSGLPPEARRARFVCVMVFMRHAEDPVPLICQGTWSGRIAEHASGRNGFGYDPVFVVDDRGRTSAELDPTEKARLSHRAKALAQLCAHLPEVLPRR